MKSQLKKIFFSILLLCFHFGFSQEIKLSPQATISVLTCGPGTDLYASFGHSAFRVHDPVLGIDVVYNYGTFNFNRPGFYTNFAKGKLIYSLSRQKTANFLYAYELENRWVKEQQLQLTLDEKNGMFQFLEHNNQPRNKEYKYDFFYDNCSSKIREVIDQNLNQKVTYDPTFIKDPWTFRELIHQKLNVNSWASFGIDLALGAVIDVKASVQEHQFLPEYMFQQLTHSTKSGNPFVSKELNLIKSSGKTAKTSFLSTPLFWFILFMIAVVLLTYFDLKNRTRRKWLDFTLFFISGLAGLLLMFLWFLTDHTATANNFNVLWVFPLNSIIAFYSIRKKTPVWMSKYMLLVFGMLILVIVFWIIGIQVFSPLIIPLCLAFGIRYLFLHNHYKNKTIPVT